MKRLLFSLGLLAAAAAPAQANVAGGSIIHSSATLSFDGGQVAASVDVSVVTVAAAPDVSVTPASQSVAGGAQTTFTYAITANANGSDTYTLSTLHSDSGVLGAPALALELNGVPVTGVTLGASVTSRASDAGVVYLPAGSETNLSVGDVVVFRGIGRYRITLVTPGTPAITNGAATSAEVPTALALTPEPGSAPMLAGTVPAGTQLGEQQQLTLRATASVPSVSGVNGQHNLNLRVTTAATNTSGGQVSYTTAAGTGNQAVLVVTAPGVSLLKEVRNVSKNGGFGTSGITAQSGDVLEYRLTATVAAGSAARANSHLTDSLPAYVAYRSGSMSLNGTAVAEPGAQQLFLATGLTVNTPSGGAGQLQPGESAVLLFQVSVN